MIRIEILLVTLMAAFAAPGLAAPAPATAPTPAASTATSPKPVSVSAEGLWRDAVALYTMESDDYVQTLSDTLGELRYWRQKVLSERFEERISHLEAVLSKSNNEVLTELEEYLRRNGIEGLDDSLMMRLAQLNYDRANFDMTEKMRRYEGELAQFQAGLRGAAPLPPAPDYAKTIFYTSELLRRFPNSPLADRAYYLLGYCLYDGGQTDKASKIYEKLVELHPYSDLAPEAHWRLAENYFDDNNFSAALEHYEFLAAGHSPFAQKALYKEGATLYAQGRYDAAAPVFLKLFRSSSENLGGADPETQTLYDESIDYLAHLRAKGVNLKVDEDTDSLITEQLAEAYRRANDEDDARNTYLRYVAGHPFSKWSPKFMDKVIESYASENELAKAQSVRNNLVRALNPASPYWAKYKNDVYVTLENQDLYETHLLASAEYYADQAHMTKRARDYDAATEYYRSFVLQYPNSPLHTQAIFELAELQYFRGHYAEASRYYEQVVAAADGSDFLDEAAYGYLLSEAKRVDFPLSEKEAVKPLRTAEGTLAPETQVTAQEAVFLKAAKVYVTTIGHGSRRQKVLYRVAEVLFKHNQFDKCREALEMVLKEHDNSSLSTNAVRLIALSYDVQGDWRKVVETNQRLLAAAPSADPREAEDMMTAQAASVALNSAWHLEKSGRNAEAAAQYEQYSIAFPHSQDAPFALFHAGVLNRQMGRIATSDKFFNRLIRDYKNSEDVPQALFFLAANQESLLHFEQAAQGYENFGARFKTHPLSTQAYLNAATLRKGMLQYEKAADDYVEYNRRVQDDEVEFKIADLYKKAGRFDRALKTLGPFVTGRYGRDLFIRAVFQRAMLAESPKASKNTVFHAVEDCLAVEEAGRRYHKTLAARTLEAVAGCGYVHTWKDRNELLSLDVKTDSPAVESKIDGLFKEYAAVQAKKSQEWTIRAMADAGLVLDTLARKIQAGDGAKSQELEQRALVFYKKVYDLKDATADRQIPEFVMDGLKRLSPGTVALTDDASFWFSSLRDTRLVSVQWGNDPAGLKAYFDQRKWDDLEQAAGQMINDQKVAYAFQAKARAQAELGQWSAAKETLSLCVEKLKSEDCAADLFASGYWGENVAAYRKILESALKNERHPTWLLGLAQLDAREGRTRDALTLATQAVAQDPGYAPAYAFVARLLDEAKRPELARVALDEGLRNADSDEALEIARGHLYLDLHLMELAQASADEFQDMEQPGGGVQVFVARNFYDRGKKNEAFKVLERAPGTEADRLQMLVGRFYFQLMDKNQAEADQSFGDISKLADQDSTAAYLAGIYLENFKHDPEKAREYLAKARLHGAWGRHLDDGLNGNRLPAEEKPMEKK